jgi:hypothetical protein
MLKLLAVITVVFAIAQAPVPASRKAPDHPAHNSKEESRTTKSSTNPPNYAAPIPAQNERRQSLKTASASDPDHLQQSAVNISCSAPVPEWAWHDRTAWLSGLILTGFLIWGVIVARRTLRAIEKQVTASHDGLRAWVAGNVREIEPIENPLGRNLPPQRRFRWEIKNYGQTPAFIKCVAVEYRLNNSPDGTATLKSPPRPTHKFLGADRKEANILTIRNEDLRQCDRRMKFWSVIIRVEYDDAFGRHHETAANFSYYSPRSSSDPVARGFYQSPDTATNYNT